MSVYERLVRPGEVCPIDWEEPGESMVDEWVVMVCGEPAAVAYSMPDNDEDLVVCEGHADSAFAALKFLGFIDPPRSREPGEPLP